MFSNLIATTDRRNLNRAFEAPTLALLVAQHSHRPKVAAAAQVELGNRRGGRDCGCGWGDFCDNPHGGGVLRCDGSAREALVR